MLTLNNRYLKSKFEVMNAVVDHYAIITSGFLTMTFITLNTLSNNLFNIKRII